MYRRTFTTCLLAFSLIAFLPGCRPASNSGPSVNKDNNSGTNSSDLREITIGTLSKAIGNSPFHVAYHFNWFAEHPLLKGIKIRYIEYNDRPTVSDAFSQGDLHVIFCADVPQILCRAQGNDIRMVALSCNVDQDILVRAELPLKTVRDLRGKKLAVQQGSSSHFGLLKVLQEDNMTLDDIDVRYMTAAEGRTAFETGQIDAWAIWAPFVEQQQASGKGKLVAAGKAPINSCMSVSHSLLADHEQTVKGLVEVIQRAKQWIHENPKESQAIMADTFGLEPKVLELAWPKHNWLAQIDEDLIEQFQWKSEFMTKSGQTRSTKVLDVRNDLLDLRFVPKEVSVKPRRKAA